MKKAFNCLFLLTVLFGASIFAQTTIAVIDLEGIGISGHCEKTQSGEKRTPDDGHNSFIFLAN